MSEHDYITRGRWWGWDEETRDAWTSWFTRNGLSVDDIADFHVHDRTVTVRVYLTNEEGERYLVRDELGLTEVASEKKSLRSWGRPPVPDAAGTRI